MMNYFDLFDLPKQFALDEAQLTCRYHQLQQALHPDRFVQASDSERYESVLQTATINEGYQTLKSPLKRAIYLLTQQKRTPDLEQQTTMDDSVFLLQQIAWREQLDEEDLSPKFVAEVTEAISEAMLALEGHFANQQWEQAGEVVMKLQFYTKFDQQLKEKLEKN